MTQGGKRDGAGRKPIDPKLKKLSVSLTLEKDVVEWLDSLPGNRSSVVNSLLKCVKASTEGEDS